MIWSKPGHELDQYVESLKRYFDGKMNFYIFGAGRYGRELLPVFKTYNCIEAIIDNDTNKIGKKIDGVNIISLNRYLQNKNGKIVIAASKKNTDIIMEQLRQNGLELEKDFWIYDEFVNYIFPIISTYFLNKSYMALAQISLTERCTLKCKKCAHACFATDNAWKDLTLQQAYKSAEAFFSKIDFVKEFVLIGGEPLLYKELEKVIQYIGDKYRKQIGIYSITTNGTIIPDESTLAVCKKYGVFFRISNYSQQIPGLGERYEKLVGILKQYNIEYYLGKPEFEWMDYGFEYINRSDSEAYMIKIFDICKTPCREVRESKLYYCVMARSVSDNLGYNVGSDDYLDLEELEAENYKKVLLEFNLGYSKKGYLDMCRHCRGADAKNYPIPAAEQVK